MLGAGGLTFAAQVNPRGIKAIESRRQVFVHHLAKLCQVHLLALHGQPHTAKAKVLFYFRKAHNRRSPSILLLFSL